MYKIHRSHHYLWTLLNPVSLIAVLGIVLILSAVVNTSARAEEVILITGFEPFGNRSINSSWEAVRRLNGRLFRGRRVIALELPVVWDQASHQLQAAIDRYHPELVINVGQGGNRLELDTSAHNLVSNIADNSGARPKSRLIATDGLPVYTTPLNLDVVALALAHAGIQTELSQNAGTYLCNFVSYHSYEYLAQIDPDAVTFFVHVPPISSLDNANDRRIMAQSVDSLGIILDTVSRQLDLAN